MLSNVWAMQREKIDFLFIGATLVNGNMKIWPVPSRVLTMKSFSVILLIIENIFLAFGFTSRNKISFSQSLGSYKVLNKICMSLFSGDAFRHRIWVFSSLLESVNIDPTQTKCSNCFMLWGLIKHAAITNWADVLELKSRLSRF